LWIEQEFRWDLSETVYPDTASGIPPLPDADTEDNVLANNELKNTCSDTVLSEKIKKKICLTFTWAASVGIQFMVTIKSRRILKLPGLTGKHSHAINRLHLQLF